MSVQTPLGVVGFRVEAPGGWVGTVHGVRRRTRLAPHLPALVIEDGHARLVTVPADEIAAVLPAERRVLLRAAPPPG